jgi:hypothetical protein
MKLTIEQHYLIAEKIRHHSHFANLIGRQTKMATLAGKKFLITKTEADKDLVTVPLDFIVQCFQSDEWLQPLYSDIPELQELKRREVLGLLSTALSHTFDTDRQKAKNLTPEQIAWFEKKFQNE